MSRVSLPSNVSNTICEEYDVRVAHKPVVGEKSVIEPVYRELGQRVAHARRSAGLTQSAVADRAGIGRPTLANIEKGRQRVLYHQLLDISQALGVNPGELLPAPPTVSLALGHLDALHSPADVVDWARRALARTDGENRAIGS